MTKAHADLKENYSLAAIYISQLEEEKAELLEALKTCLEHFNTTDAEYDRNGTKYDLTGMRDFVRNAIQKAEGKP
jgi:hypothetical protein